MDNVARYGFRWSKANGGEDVPFIVEKIVASAASFDVSGGQTGCNLQPGDVVALVSDGTVINCAGAETTPATPWGVVRAVMPYYDSTIGQSGAMKPSPYLPSGVTWGTNYQRASKVLCVPLDKGIWEVDADDAVTATTYGAYVALIGENVSMINTNVSGSLNISPKIKISTHATTNTLKFRIWGVSQTKDNQDYSGANVKLLIEPNIMSAPWSSTTGV